MLHLGIDVLSRIFTLLSAVTFTATAVIWSKSNYLNMAIKVAAALMAILGWYVYFKT